MKIVLDRMIGCYKARRKLREHEKSVRIAKNEK